MLEGIEGLKLLKESYYYKLNDIGFIMLFIGIMLLIASLFLIVNEYEKVWNITCVIVAIIGLSLIINSLIFGRKEYKKYILTPIEEHYSIDLNKYIIDSESDGNLIVIRERQLYNEGDE